MLGSKLTFGDLFFFLFGFIPDAQNASFDLQPVSPFRLDLAVWTLRRRPDNLFDRWNGTTYRRVLIADDKPFEIAVTQYAESKNLRVEINGTRLTSSVKTTVTAALERLLGLNVDLQMFYRLSKTDHWLKPLASQFQGMKPPRLLSPFEALINAVACQQLTLTMGIRLLNRLTEAYGMALKTENGIVHAVRRTELPPCSNVTIHTACPLKQNPL